MDFEEYATKDVVKTASSAEFRDDQPNELMASGLNNAGESARPSGLNLQIDVNKQSGILDSGQYSDNRANFIDVVAPSQGLTCERSSSISSVDAIVSFVMQSDTDGETAIQGPQMVLGTGNGINIICYTHRFEPDSEQLSDNAEDSIGWFINANWGDADNDGWTGVLPPTPNATFTPDKDDQTVMNDKSLWLFEVSITGPGLTIPPWGGFLLKYSSDHIRVHDCPDNVPQKSIGGVIPSDTDIPVGSMTINGNTAYRYFWAEGLAGSSTTDGDMISVNITGGMPNTVPYDTVRVIVIETDPSWYFFGGQNGTAQAQNVNNSVKHSTRSPGTSDNNGIISWDDANGDGVKGDADPNCKFFANAMEVAASVKPANMTAQYLSENLLAFQWQRERWGKDWVYLNNNNNFSWSAVGDETDKWYPDKAAGHGDEDCIPDPFIYDLDEPGCPAQYYDPNQFSKVAQFKNFREYVEVKIYEEYYTCSRFARWHSQWLVVPAAGFNIALTRDTMAKQKLAVGWLTIPASPDNF